MSLIDICEFDGDFLNVLILLLTEKTLDELALRMKLPCNTMFLKKTRPPVMFSYNFNRCDPMSVIFIVDIRQCM